MPTRIGFYGAAETVTGSRHLITSSGKQVLVDCGIFQGDRELRQRNWQPFAIPPSEIDAIVITHAHQDHIGWLPRLVREGYRGPIYATPATIGLSKISLPDSGRIQEEDARRANKHGSRHQPALPLYTEEDAYEALKLFLPVKYHTELRLPGDLSAEYLCAGHILGSAMVRFTLSDRQSLLMGGDLGRFNTPIIRDPEIVKYADYLVIESTYGDREHSHENVLDKLQAILDEAWRTQATVIVPSFSIGRTQELLYYCRILQDQGRMPRIPVFLDSPMAVSVTQLYASSKEEQDEDMLLSVEQGRSELEPDGVQFVRDREQSKALNRQPGPVMIVAGSGMANGGRVVHHLLHHLADPTTIVLFTGYQAEGTLGRRILDGAPEVRIMGDEVPVRARVERLEALSAHADSEEMLSWLGGFVNPPKRTFIVHGEPHAQVALRAKIGERLGWETSIPYQGQNFDLA